MGVAKQLDEIYTSLTYNKVKKNKRKDLIKILHGFGILLKKKKKQT